MRIVNSGDGNPVAASWLMAAGKLLELLCSRRNILFFFFFSLPRMTELNRIDLIRFVRFHSDFIWVYIVFRT